MRIRRSSVQLTALMGAAVAVATLAAVASPVEADPSASASTLTTQDKTVLPPQAQVQAAMRFVHSQSNQHGKHVYASTDWDDNRIVIAADSEVRADLSGYDGTDIEGLRVDVIPAVVTPLEFEAAMHAIDKETFPNSDRVGSFGLPIDTSTVDVNIIGLDDLSPAEQTSLTADLERISDQPVRLKPYHEGVPLRRGNFADPWEGGGQLLHNVTGTSYVPCSTGFAVLDGIYGRILTARHCDGSGSGTNWVWTNWAETETFNNASGVQLGATALDTMLIDPIGGTEGTVFGGAWNQAPGTARYKLDVNGAASVSIGDQVCTSGAMSGEHFSNGCLIRVDDPDHVTCQATASGICHRWWGYNIILNGVAGAVGDSGGPVYENLGNDRVGARGIIWNGEDQVDCVNTRVSNTTCYTRVRWAGINDVLQSWDVDIETN